MTSYIQKGNLQIAEELFEFINHDVLPGTQIEEKDFWQKAESIFTAFTQRNCDLLAKRTRLQTAINEFHIQNPDVDFTTYKSFLKSIDYLVDAPAPFSIRTTNVDREIATVAGAQLVVPINNARYALNAVNARWGSLYDALYGTDVIASDNGAEKGSTYNPIRGQKVIEKARQYLDSIIPLTHGSHVDAVAYSIDKGAIEVTLKDDTRASLAQPSQLVGYQGSLTSPSAILVVHNELHAELQFDRTHPIGASDASGLKDIFLESAVTTIMDCEDSVAAVDAEDKTLVYRNWLGLMQGNLSVEMAKGGKTITRKMNADRIYTGINGTTFSLPGRSLMFVRNVGHLMRNNAILLNGEEVYEGIMDGIMTSLIAKHDLLKNSPFENSKTGSIYIVKPKMHGPEEVAYTNDLFAAIEDALGYERFTLKVGIMDEERRTSVNLSACIEAAKDRVVFINTGFLDRTGDEIHTSMQRGPFAGKAELKQRPWIGAYEKSNVITGLNAGLSGKAQIGKGMWPIPDQMAAMLEAKSGHPQAGANTAWVPSPTAATLHALHYHQINVFERQKEMSTEEFDGLDTILDVPLMTPDTPLSVDEIQKDLDNNVQGILGYVVRWVHQGIGCSKVPDINNVGLMEDRATLRISSQHIANWLEHGLVSAEQVDESLTRLATLVDEQNKDDAQYIPMTPNVEDSIGFQAAKDLIFLGKVQPSGYTEPLLHMRRLEMKRHLKSA